MNEILIMIDAHVPDPCFDQLVRTFRELVHGSDPRHRVPHARGARRRRDRSGHTRAAAGARQREGTCAGPHDTRYYFITLLLHCTGRDRPGVNAHARVFLLTAERWPWLPGPGARALAIPVQIYARTTINQFADGGTVRE